MDHLPTRGDYFAEGDFLHADPATGVLTDRAGIPMVVLPESLLHALNATVAAECGPAADRVLADCGRSWGRAFAERFDRDLSAYFGVPLAEWPVARFEACLSSAMAHLGWGRPRLDTSRFAQGLLSVEIHYAVTASPDGAPAAALVAGVLGGLFSAFAGQDLVAVFTGRSDGNCDQFVLGLASRVGPLADVARHGRSHDEVLDDLAETRA
jgi:hypothetical protein